MKKQKIPKIMYSLYIIFGLIAIIKSIQRDEFIVGIMFFVFAMVMIGITEQARQENNYRVTTDN